MKISIFHHLIIIVSFVISNSLIVSKTPLEAGVDYTDEEEILKKIEAASFEFPRIRDSLIIEPSINQPPPYSYATDVPNRELSRNHRSQERPRHPRRSSVDQTPSSTISSADQPERLNSERLQSERPLSDQRRKSDQTLSVQRPLVSPYLQPPPTTESLLDAQFQNWIPVPWIKLLSEASFRRSNPPPIEFEMIRPPPPVRQNRIDSNNDYDHSANEADTNDPPNEIISKREGVEENYDQNAYETPNSNECTCTPVQRYEQKGSGAKNFPGAKNFSGAKNERSASTDYKSLDDVLAEVIDESGYDSYDRSTGGANNQMTGHSAPSFHQDQSPNRRPLPTPESRSDAIKKYNQNGGKYDQKTFKGMIIDNEETLAMVCRQFTSGGNKYVAPPPPPPKTFLSPAPYRQDNDEPSGVKTGDQSTPSYQSKSEKPNYQKTKAPKITTSYTVSVTHPPTPMVKWPVTGHPINPYVSNQWKNQTLGGVKGGPKPSGVKGYQTRTGNKTPIRNVSVKTTTASIPTTFSESYLNNHEQLATRQLLPEKSLISNGIKSRSGSGLNVSKPRAMIVYGGQEQQQKYWNEKARSSVTPPSISQTPPSYLDLSSQTPPTSYHFNSESYQSSHPVPPTTRLPLQSTLYTSPSVTYVSSTTAPPNGGVKGGGVKGGRRSQATPFYNWRPKTDS